MLLLLRATDGHAKNFSIFLQPGGYYRMTPLYDVLSARPIIGQAACNAQLGNALCFIGATNAHHTFL
ncbi:MAG: HipA N-terminal domain protein, partial [Herminiimonas sp.]|nr:HipA N-terminal domain protein [Herminiimonas sp.]